MSSARLSTLLVTPSTNARLRTGLLADRFAIGDRLVFRRSFILAEEPKRGRRDALLGEPECFEHLLAGTRCAKGVDPDRGAIRAGIALPADGDAGLDRDARGSASGRARILDRRLLCASKSSQTAWRRHAPGRRRSRARHALRRRARLPSRCRSARRPARRFPRRPGCSHPASHRPARRDRSSIGRSWRRGRSRSVRHCAQARAARRSPFHWRPPGRITVSFGISRSDIICSTGSCVGPSSPTAMLSWVKTKIVLQVRKRGEANGRAHVVGEDEEGRRERDDAAMGGHAVDGAAHRVLADAEVDVAPGVAPVAAGEPWSELRFGGRRLEIAGALHRGVGRGIEIGGAADEGRHLREEGLDDRSDALRVATGLSPASQFGRSASQPSEQALRRSRASARRRLRDMLPRRRRSACFQAACSSAPVVDGVAEVGDGFLRQVEGRLARPAEIASWSRALRPDRAASRGRRRCPACSASRSR